MKTIWPDYHNSILNVSASILKHYGVKTNHSDISELTVHLDNNPKHVILVLLDGMGMNILKENTDPNFLLRKHIKKEITSVYPSTTVAATTSVISGLSPFEHGHIGWTQYNKKEDSNTVVFLNTDFYDEKKVLKENFKDRELYYETIFEKIKDKNPNLRVNELFPNFRPKGFASFKQQVEALISISKGTPSFSYCYWTQPDYLIHESGVKSDDVKALMSSLEANYKYLCENVSKDTLIITIADHGLVDIKAIPIIKEKVLLSTLKRLPSVEPRCCAFFVKDDQHDLFKSEFKRIFDDKFMLMTKKEFFDSKLLGAGEKHIGLDDYVGDYMAIATSPYIISFKEENFFKAHHAGLLTDEMTVPLLIFAK
ncbi:MAG TPA: alkaline phosphatase family protein [Acholeplasma sp.]|nr:alkaline phosphatase family protein [Acholeplasma sp.]